MTGLLLCLAVFLSSLLIAIAAGAVEGRCR